MEPVLPHLEAAAVEVAWEVMEAAAQALEPEEEEEEEVREEMVVTLRLAAAAEGEGLEVVELRRSRIIPEAVAAAEEATTARVDCLPALHPRQIVEQVQAAAASIVKWRPLMEELVLPLLQVVVEAVVEGRQETDSALLEERVAPDPEVLQAEWGSLPEWQEVLGKAAAAAAALEAPVGPEDRIRL